MAGASIEDVETERDMAATKSIRRFERSSEPSGSNSTAKLKAPTFACNISQGFFEIVAGLPEVCAYVKE